MSKHLLLTGCTGLLGQYLLRDLLLEGVSLAVVIRSRKGETAADRLERALRHWEKDLGRPLPRPVCLEGDLTCPGLGLGEEERAWLRRHGGAVLHNAASLTFNGTDRARDPWLSNLTGTENVLDVCRQTGLHDFHYMSTAYVCGQRTGLIREDELEKGQAFRNDYEHCKFEAERLVRSADCIDRLTVYRPAIIVGDSRTGYTTTYHGLYSYLYFAWLYGEIQPRDPDGRLYIPVRLNLTGDERRNLVPVDWVSAVTTHIFTHPELHGQTYHLTPPHPVTARAIEEAAERAFNIYGPVFGGPDALHNTDWNDVEKMFYAFVEQYQPYWSEEPRFDDQNTRTAIPLPCPPIDAACLERLIDFAVSDQWGKGRKKAKSKTPAVAVGSVES